LCDAIISKKLAPDFPASLLAMRKDLLVAAVIATSGRPAPSAVSGKGRRLGQVQCMLAAHWLIPPYFGG
ncbi:MAG: hypothetical protein EBT19_06310, partial [Methylocystaceae bacterium]|nr:hypothetical protein [Methylocystaceae bacterium]